MNRVREKLSQWYIQLGLVLVTVVMGMLGYLNYYRDLKAAPISAVIVIQSIISTIKLFTFGFDVDSSCFQAGLYPNGQKVWVLWMLQCARILGLLLTGTTLFKVLSNHMIHIRELIRFLFWEQRSEKLMLFGKGEENCRLCRSAGRHYAGMIVCANNTESVELAEKGFPCFPTRDMTGLLSEQIRKTIRKPGRKTSIIINTNDEEMNLALSKTAIEDINAYFKGDIEMHDHYIYAAKKISQIRILVRKEIAVVKGTAAGSLIKPNVYAGLIKKAREAIVQTEEPEEFLKKIGDIEQKLGHKASFDAEQTEVIARVLDGLNSLCEETETAIIKASLPAEKKITEILKRIRIVVFANRDYQAIYNDIQKESFCPIKCLNKYRLTAYDFVSRYPLTEFIPEHKRKDEILTYTGCVTPESEFNMILIGFGNTNQEIFQTSFASDQFVEYVPGGMPKPKPVRYFIFDKNKELNEKNLNHDVFRYQEDFLNLLDTDIPGAPRTEDYLPIAPNPAEIRFFPLNINTTYFYNRIREICKANPLSVNHIIIAFGEDLENIDLAQRLVEKKSEWGLENLRIFTKIRNPENEKNIRYFSRHDYIPFGNEDFSLESLLDNEIERMASRKSMGNTVTRFFSKYPAVSMDECTFHSDYEWLTMDHTKRLSSFFNFIGLRLKLNLLGFDYQRQEDRKQGDPEPVSLQEFAECYSAGDEPEGMTEEKGLIYSYRIIDQREDFNKDITRKNLGVQEHYRWNAYMIMNGFIPGPIEQIRKKNSKDYVRRFHSNITTQEGLFLFRELQAQIMNTSEAKEDVIHYDYMQMDGAWANLKYTGYEMIRVGRKPEKRSGSNG